MKFIIYLIIIFPIFSYCLFGVYEEKINKDEYIFLDTSTKKGKILNLVNKIKNYPYTAVEKYDTIDLNYDGYNDLIIYYYNEKSLRQNLVYFYSPLDGSFIYNNQLSNLNNPSFFIEKKQITGFYISTGGGNGIKLKWINNTWDTIETFNFDSGREGKTEWKVTKITKRDTIVFYKDLFMIPDTNILLNKYYFQK